MVGGGCEDSGDGLNSVLGEVVLETSFARFERRSPYIRLRSNRELHADRR